MKVIYSAYIHICIAMYWGARFVMIIVERNEYFDWSSNFCQVCISHNGNTLGKGTHPMILLLAIDK